MSDSIKIVECFHTPSPIYAIYDYTKIAYIVGNYICLREISTSEVRPIFIELENNHNNIYIGLLSYPNCLILAQCTHSRDIYLHFYQQNQVHLKFTSQIAKRSDPQQPLKMQLFSSNNYIYIIVKRQSDNQIIIINFNTRLFAGRTFISGQLTQFRVKNIQTAEYFSIVLKDSQQIIQYQVIPGKFQEHSIVIAQKTKWNIKNNTILHCWCRQQIAIFDGDVIKIYGGNKQLQTIKQKTNSVSYMKTTISGFLVVCSRSIRFYKRNSNFFQLASQYALEKMPYDGLQLSPQEDILSFYNQKEQSIFYALNYEIQHENSNKIRQIKFDKIEHNSTNLKAFNSIQGIIVMTTKNRVMIYSSITYKTFFNMKVTVRDGSKANQTQKRLLRSTTMGAQRQRQYQDVQVIQTIAVHPTNAIIAIAFRNIVKIYYILYNELRSFKEIHVANVKEVGFSRSGNIFYAKISGKQGSKIYIYNTLLNYQPIQILSSNKSIQLLQFSPYDNIIYGFFNNGYYSWSIQSNFKHRNQNNIIVPFDIKGAQITQTQIMLWGSKQLLKIDLQGEMQSITFNKQLSCLLFQNKNIIFMTKNGQINRCKTIHQINNVINQQGFKIPPNSQLLSIKSNIILCLSQDGNIICLQHGQQQKNSLQLLSIQRKKIIRYQEQYLKYQKELVELQQKFGNQLQNLRQQFAIKQARQRQIFLKQIKDKQQRYIQLRTQKLRTQCIMQQALQAKQQQTHLQIKQLQKIYQRKLALTTNKLLTSQEIGFRNQLISKQNLNQLQSRHSLDIQKIREQYSRALQQHLHQNRNKNDLFLLKKEYQTKLSQLQIENELLLKRFQNLTESNILNLKKNVLNLQLKYGEVISQKYNLQKQYNDQAIQLQDLRQKKGYLQGRLNQQIRRSQQLSKECNRIEKIITERNLIILALEKRVEQLQKSNEIFKYRIIQMKNINDPKEEQILKLKDNMIQLQEEYQKIQKKAYQHELTISLLRKDIHQTKILLNSSIMKEKKLDKNYRMIIDKIREVTKSPIQEIRKLLLKILDNFQTPVNGEKVDHNHKRSNSPLEELNRVREHLQICLKDVVQTGKKSQKQKDVQISRKNRQNSQLLRQINELRVRVKDLQVTLKERQLQLQQIYRQGKQNSTKKLRKKIPQRISTNFQSELSQEFTKNKTRQSFFQKSMFKGQWLQKRMKTEQGSRKKSHFSLAKQQTNPLFIESKGQQVQQLRRLLDQKETIIKQLINKIHKLS